MVAKIRSEFSFRPPGFTKEIFRRAAHAANFRVKNIFVPPRGPRIFAVFRGEMPPRRKYFKKNFARDAGLGLSTQKLTEYFQKRPLICLTEIGPVPISCGQGSGHPHPVVVDNVLGSFGNLVSPALFDRR